MKTLSLSGPSPSIYIDDFSAATRDADSAIAAHPRSDTGYFVGAEILLRKFGIEWEVGGNPEALKHLEHAIDLLQKCVALCVENKAAIESKSRNITLFLEYFREKKENQSAQPKTTGIMAPPGCEPLKILQKSGPGYTEKARSKNVTGEVKIATMFSADGTVGPTLVLSGLPDGLTEVSLHAVKSTNFIPQSCNGIPEDVVKTV